MMTNKIQFLADMLCAYVEAALFSTPADAPNGDENGHLDQYEPSKALWKRAKRDCKAFIAIAGDRIEAYDARQVGHDLWLTRNGHGAGFWAAMHERYDAWYRIDLSRIAKAMGTCELYVSRGKVMAY